MTRYVIAAALIIGTVPGMAAAQETEDKPDLRVRVGLGAQVRPDFIGADSREVVPLIRVGTAKGDDEFRFSAPDDGFGIAVISSGRLAIGPVGQLQSRRRDKDVGIPIGKVGRTLEVGAFADYVISDSVRFRTELRKGVGGHEGLVGQAGIDKIWRDGDRYVFSLGPRVLWSNSRYQRAYFGVSPEAAVLTGLPTYRPGSGIHAVALSGGLTMSLGGPFGLFGYARAERLVGDAAKSPFIRDYGARNQLSGGLGLSYTFRIER